jgi:flagellar FliL protein
MADDPDKKLVEEEKEATPAPQRRGGKKRLILISGIFLFLAAGAGSAFFFAPHLLEGLPLLGKKGPQGSSEEKKEKSPHKQGFVYSLDPFIVNLADVEPSRYLKIRIEMESQEDKEKKEVTDRLPQLRDAILTLLSSKTYKEIYDSEGKKKLKDEIVQRTNQLWSGFQFKAVYFTEFVVQ